MAFEGYVFKEKIRVYQDVFYQHVFSKDGKLMGVIVDYEMPDDFHYELTAENWIRFSDQVLDKSIPESDAFSSFIKINGIDSEKGLFSFENKLDELQIVYKKIALY